MFIIRCAKYGPNYDTDPRDFSSQEFDSSDLNSLINLLININKNDWHEISVLKIKEETIYKYNQVVVSAKPIEFDYGN